MIEIGGTPIINTGGCGYGGYGYDGMGAGGNWIWGLLLFALIGGNNFFGGNRGAVTEGEVYKSQQFQNIDDGLRNLGDGQCQLGFQLTNTVKDGNYSTSRQLDGMNNNFNNAICTLGYQNLDQTSRILEKISSCCCSTERGQDGINYNIKIAANEITKNQDANAAVIRDDIRQLKDYIVTRDMANKDETIRRLENEANTNKLLCRMNEGIGAWLPWGQYGNPTTGYNNGCVSQRCYN